MGSNTRATWTESEEGRLPEGNRIVHQEGQRTFSGKNNRCPVLSSSILLFSPQLSNPGSAAAIPLTLPREPLLEYGHYSNQAPLSSDLWLSPKMQPFPPSISVQTQCQICCSLSPSCCFFLLVPKIWVMTPELQLTGNIFP